LMLSVEPEANMFRLGCRPRERTLFCEGTRHSWKGEECQMPLQPCGW
jgi:hypothetical protein